LKIYRCCKKPGYDIPSGIFLLLGPGKFSKIRFCKYLKLTSTPLIVVPAGLAKQYSGRMTMKTAFNKNDFIFKAKKNLQMSFLHLYLLGNEEI